MEESCDDSDYIELINQGREDHPLVKYTRLVKTKKDELEYKYNPVSLIKYIVVLLVPLI